MKDFEDINWKQYNKPPFYQQWLCEGDTIKLATFGDQNLTDIVLQVLKLKDQWNLENTRGVLLDRIGKLLRETRNGNDDGLYRKYLYLRAMLNTADGSPNNIIKIMKFIYETEVIHITPDYPAGLVIEHRGELTPGLDFNAVIKQVIPAGVSYYTKEIFDFAEGMLSADNQFTQVHRDSSERFEGRVYRNRRVLRNGYTILPTELKKAFHNGVNYHNALARHNGQYETEADSYITPPVRRESGYFDPLLFGFGLLMKDFQFSRLFHNGGMKRRMRAKRDGKYLHSGVTNRMPVARHNGWSQNSISDTASVFKLKNQVFENSLLNESLYTNITAYDNDQFRKPYKHKGTYKHNSSIFHSGQVLDFLVFIQKFFIQDIVAGATYHNGILRRNGNENRSGRGNTAVYEKQVLNLGLPINENMQGTEKQTLNVKNGTVELTSKFYKHNRIYMRDGMILRNSLINDKTAMWMKLSALFDNAEGIPRRNSSICRSGIERHSLVGVESAYEIAIANVKNNDSEIMETSENQTLVYNHIQEDAFTHDYRRDKSINHNGVTYHCGSVNDKNVLDIALVPMVDIQHGRLLRNTSTKRNGEEQRQSKRIAYEVFTIGIKYHHFHNGDCFRNNGIKHNTCVLIPLKDIA
jgi:hypothetical protein